jgi:hypothetical protein
MYDNTYSINSPFKPFVMYTYFVYDSTGHCIGFTDVEHEAQWMAEDYQGYYELEYKASNSIFG